MRCGFNVTDSQSLLSDAGLLSDTGLAVCPFRHWSRCLSFQTLVSRVLLSDTGLAVCPFRRWSRGFSFQTLVSQPSVLSDTDMISQSVLSDTDMISQSVLSDTGLADSAIRHWSRSLPSSSVCFFCQSRPPKSVKRRYITDSITFPKAPCSAPFGNKAIVRVKGPAVRVTSPAVRVTSPAVRVKSPAVRVKSPAVRVKSPVARCE